jgi:lipooligosaccharide transport system permease protein
MFLFSGTFFPVSGIPAWAGLFTLIFPLYHLVELTRFFCIGAMESYPALNLVYLVLFTLVFGYLGLRAMKRRLIK